MFSGDAQVVAGIISGAAVTNLIVGFVPSTWSTGIPGYIVTAIAAVVQGQAVGKIFKQPLFGKYMTWGGFTFLALKIINDMMPSLSGYLGISGMRGMGLLAPTQGFMLPNVNMFGSMGRFQIPNSIASKIQAAAMTKGVHGLPRIGRIQ